VIAMKLVAPSKGRDDNGPTLNKPAGKG
jgi:hypothetical protein